MFTGWSCNTSNICRSDNSGLTFYAESGFTAAAATRIDNVLLISYDATDLSVTKHLSPVYTGSSETDTIFQVGAIGGGYIGLTWCDDPISSTKCDQHYVRFVSNNPATSLICHETGHSVGLLHGQNSETVDGFVVDNNDPELDCMRTPESGVTAIGASNTAQINGVY